MDRRDLTAGYGEFFRLPDVAMLAGVALVAVWLARLGPARAPPPG